jgi:hypothetical protein
MQSKRIVSLVVSVAIIASGAFYGGMTYAKSKTPTRPAGANMRVAGAGGAARQFGSGQGGAGGFTTGEVLSKDDTSITVKLQDGGSKIVFISASTTVSTTSQGSLNDVTPGTNIMVGGSANQDGSVMARTIQIRPAGETGVPMFAPRGERQ